MATQDQVASAIAQVPLFHDMPLKAALKLITSTMPDELLPVIQLGQGGFGCVLGLGDHAVKLAINRKKLARDLLQEHGNLRALETAASMMGGVPPAGVLLPQQVQTVGNTKVLVMRRMDESLFECICRGEVQWASSYDRLVKHLVDGLAFLHRSGFVHNDLKPENILREGDDFYITDLGHAHRNPKNSRQGIHYYQCTWAYRSLASMLQGDTAASTQADDMHALGVILWEAMNGSFFTRTDSSRGHVVCKLVEALGRHALPASLVDTPLGWVQDDLKDVPQQSTVDELVSNCTQTVDKQVLQAFRACFAIDPIRDACALKRLVATTNKRANQDSLTMEADGVEVGHESLTVAIDGLEIVERQ